MMLTASRGQARANSTTYNNTQVAAKQVQIDSGGDTTLKGAVVKADQVTANVGGNLDIESLQDSATYTDKQSSSGVGVSICVPPFCFGQVAIVNVSAAKAKINVNQRPKICRATASPTLMPSTPADKMPPA